MSNPTPNNNNNNTNTNTNNDGNNDTQSWWSSFTSTPVDDASSFDADSFAEEAESASWLDIFKKK